MIKMNKSIFGQLHVTGTKENLATFTQRSFTMIIQKKEIE